MDFNDIDFYLIFDLFLLLLIGMGPKIALVPFLELTQGMEPETQKRIADLIPPPPGCLGINHTLPPQQGRAGARGARTRPLRPACSREASCRGEPPR